MKRLLILTLALLLITSCHHSLSKEKKRYQAMQQELINYDNFTQPLTYDVNVYLDRLVDTEIIYRVIIDNPTESMHNISVLVIHNYPTNDIFPSIGIFDEKVNLIPNYVDMETNHVKGITLTGYIPYVGDILNFDGVFKVLIEYEDESGNFERDYYQYQN